VVAFNEMRFTSPLFLGFLALLCSSHTFASLGELRADVEKRLGAPFSVLENKIHQNEVGCNYISDEHKIFIIYVENRSSCEWYFKSNYSPLEENWIYHVLNNNAKGSWMEDSSTLKIGAGKTWIDSESRAVALYNKEDFPVNTLIIATPDYSNERWFGKPKISSEDNLSKKVKGSYVDYELSNKVTDIKPFEMAFDQVLHEFIRRFPHTSFDLQSRPVVRIYGSKTAYSGIENQDQNVLGHQVSFKVCNAHHIYSAYAQGKPINERQYHLATYLDNSLDVYRHELSHVLLTRWGDPAFLSLQSNGKSIVGLGDVEIASILHEGLAEEVASKFNEAVYENRVCQLAVTGGAKRSPDEVRDVIIFGKHEMDPYYEGVMLVRWLSQIQDGMPVFRQLCATKTNQFEAIIKANQTARRADRDGLKEFYTWRTNEFNRLDFKISLALQKTASLDTFITLSRDVTIFDSKGQIAGKILNGNKIIPSSENSTNLVSLICASGPLSGFQVFCKPEDVPKKE
jgi:hypothetical protein